MDTLKDLLYSIGSFFAGLIRAALEWFLGLDLLNRIIVVNTATAFLAIVLPIGKYYIFESWFEINNPLAVYMIVITLVMFGTVFLNGMRWVFPVRIVINVWYFIALVYLWVTHTFSHAPYNISYGIVFNLAAPLVYGVVSVLIFMEE
ncbi:MAG TPA: hypothetical protein P5120_13600 [Spirochaetota bacterium]|nr:hypothetical protein [Spirochaetota bacterium]